MYYPQGILLSFIAILLLYKASNNDAFILFVGYCFYFLTIGMFEGGYYYTGSALINMIIGLSLHFINRKAAMCSYILVPVNMFGFLIWYSYSPPDIYNYIAISVLIAQILFVLPRGIQDGLRRCYKHIMAKHPVFNSNQARVTMHKTEAHKKTH